MRLVLRSCKPAIIKPLKKPRPSVDRRLPSGAPHSSIRTFASTAPKRLDLTALFSHDAHLFPSGARHGDQHLAILPDTFKRTLLYAAVTNPALANANDDFPTPSLHTQVRDAGGDKGLGLFSTCAATAGDAILHERPVLLAALTRSRLGMVEDLPGTLASLCERHLSPSVIEDLLRLSKASTPLSQSPQESDSSREDPLKRIVATNTIRTDVDFSDGRDFDSFAALLLQSSRCNHR